jgi:hypothetical protein
MWQRGALRTRPATRPVHSEHSAHLRSCMHAGFLDCDWGWHNGGDEYKRVFREETIIATAHTQQYASIHEILQDDTYLFRSDDDFASSTKLASCGSAFALVAGQACPLARARAHAVHMCRALHVLSPSLRVAKRVLDPFEQKRASHTKAA